MLFALCSSCAVMEHPPDEPGVLVVTAMRSRLEQRPGCGTTGRGGRGRSDLKDGSGPGMAVEVETPRLPHDNTEEITLPPWYAAFPGLAQQPGRQA